MTKPDNAPMGAQWNDTSYPPLYQLYRRIEDVAKSLEQRRKKGWAITRPFIEELYDIAGTLKVLDRKLKPQR
jgi:hypothetical protein